MSRNVLLGGLLVAGLLLSAGCGGGGSSSGQKPPEGMKLKERPAPGAPGGSDAPADKKKAATSGGANVN